MNLLIHWEDFLGTLVVLLGLLFQKKMGNVIIPLSPLEVQQKIVRILDQLIEFTARKKRYTYYRDKVFDFTNAEIEWTLAEIADIGTGSSNTNEELDDGKYPFFVRSQEVRRKNTFEYDETAIITSGDGVGVGKIFHYIEGKYALHQRAYRIHIMDKRVLPKYYFYYGNTAQKKVPNTAECDIIKSWINK